MAFTKSCFDMVAIASLIRGSGTREAALKQPLLGHLVVAVEMTRGQQYQSSMLSTSHGRRCLNNPFYRYLISAAQGAVNRLRCRYKATTEPGGVLWELGELDRIANGSGVAP